MTCKSHIKRATFVLSPNIAVVKYWGKRNRHLNLPTNSSLSLTIDPTEMKTSTTLDLHLDERNSGVKFYLNSEEVKYEDCKRIHFVVSRVREVRSELEKKYNLAVINDCDIVITSFNNFPTASGLASSSSGYSALAKCLFEVFQLDDERYTSTLSVSEIARIGSGSAVRSLHEGYVVWEAGILEGGSDSVARTIFPGSYWDLAIVILIVSDRKKDMPSTPSMTNTTCTSELFKVRTEIAEKRVVQMINAIKEQDFDRFAELTMKDSNQMHALCLDTFPPIFYLNSTSQQIINTVHTFNNIYSQNPPPSKRNKRYRATYTFDAGPNAVLFCEWDTIDDLISVLVSKFKPSNIKDVPTFVTGRINGLSHTELPDSSLYGERVPDRLSRIVVTGVSH